MTDEPLLGMARAAFGAATKVEVTDPVEVPRSPLAIADAPLALAERGYALLAGGRVAVLMLAGGRSTRMGGQFRGDLRVGPVSGATLFELQGQRIASLRDRHAPGLRWLILTSAATTEPVRAALRRYRYFGLPPRDIWVFAQRSLPVLTDAREPLRRPNGDLITCPTGHGGMLQAMGDAGLMDRLADVDQLFSFQYPNALERIGDPVMLGYHDHGGYDATVKAVAPTLPGERVGRLAVVGGRTVVVEYHAVVDPEQQSVLRSAPMYSGTTVWSVAFLRRCLQAGIELPFHIVRHVEPGRHARLWKAEHFVFDLLLHSTSTGVVLGDRREEYAAIKGWAGPDSLAAARTALTARHRDWLSRAGAIGPAEVARLEIRPTYALTAEELRQRLSLPFSYVDGMLLE
jgi:UDP-N-acetylglucosamine/UDP-N-acetylgalactosamine diphosphorylase